MTRFIGNTRTVLEVDFQENVSKGSRDISVLLLCFPCKSPLHFWLITPTFAYKAGNERIVIGVEFQENL